MNHIFIQCDTKTSLVFVEKYGYNNYGSAIFFSGSPADYQ